MQSFVTTPKFSTPFYQMLRSIFGIEIEVDVLFNGSFHRWIVWICRRAIDAFDASNEPNCCPKCAAESDTVVTQEGLYVRIVVQQRRWRVIEGQLSGKHNANCNSKESKRRQKCQSVTMQEWQARRFCAIGAETLLPKSDGLKSCCGALPAASHLLAAPRVGVSWAPCL